MNYEKIGILALLIALFAVSATNTAVMISGSDNTKVNKSGDTLSGQFHNYSGTYISTWDILAGHIAGSISNTDGTIGSTVQHNNDYHIIISKYVTPSWEYYYNYIFSKYGLDMDNRNITNVRVLNMTGDINMSGHNVTACGNCGVGVETDPIAMSQGFVTNATMQSDNTKVNKSGDNMAGGLKINLPINLTYPNLSIDMGTDAFSFESYNHNDSLMNFMAIRAINGNSTASGTRYPYLFFGRVFADYDGKNITNMTNIPDVQQIGLLSFQGSINETKSLSGTRARIQVLSDGSWNQTHQPTMIRIWNDNGKGITIRQNDEVQIQGNFVMKNPTSGITWYSPNGSPFCETISNLGTKVITSGVCT